MSDFKQLAVWRGTLLDRKESDEFSSPETVKDFEDFFKEDAGVRVKYYKEILTLPDSSENSGGRNDVLFYVHNDDINRFTGWRLQHGMSWLEDYIDNEKDIIPDVENLEKVRCW